MPRPNIYEVHTRPLLRGLFPTGGRTPTLDDIPDGALDAIADLGMDWVWMLGVWQTGPIARAIARSIPALREVFRAELHDLREEDIVASPFAVERYVTHADLGGDAALARLCDRLRRRGLKLMLDYVPNHTGPDCPWVVEHPEWYVQGSEEDLLRHPRDYRRVETVRGPTILAHGRDPYFPGWTDTFQINHAHRGLREVRINELVDIAARCDGLRCDMAMLLLPDVFERTWGERARPADGSESAKGPFWVEAIDRVRRRYPDFYFVAEAYWGREWDLQQQGFDATYDKTLYDRLVHRDARAVRGHLNAAMDFQLRCVRFLENHDEPRAARAFEPAVHRASAAIATLVPGPHLFFEGQFEGREVRPSVQLSRRPPEAVDAATREFYARLIPLAQRPEVAEGTWRVLECRPAWHDNPSHEQFVCFSWRGEGTLVVAVNCGPDRAQCFVGLPMTELAGRTATLSDLLGPAHYERNGDDLMARGLYLDMPGWGLHAFEVLIR
jgi:glycosidase